MEHFTSREHPTATLTSQTALVANWTRTVLSQYFCGFSLKAHLVLSSTTEEEDMASAFG